MLVCYHVHGAAVIFRAKSRQGCSSSDLIVFRFSHPQVLRFSNSEEVIIDKRVNMWYNNTIENKGVIGVRRKTPAFRYGDIRHSKLRRKYGFC